MSAFGAVRKSALAGKLRRAKANRAAMVGAGECGQDFHFISLFIFSAAVRSDPVTEAL